MAKENRFGLKREDFTADQKRRLRQEAGFGCVICGNALGEYEHIDPEFSEATEHDITKMAYLCIQCHGKVTRKHLSKETVMNAKLNPFCKRKGFSFEAFDIRDASPKIHFGPMSAVNCRWAIRVNNRPVLWIDPPEEQGAPFRLNAEMRNSEGKLIFSIIENEWRIRSENWDAEVVGPNITIRNGPGQIAFVLKTVPPREIYIERMDMTIEGHRLLCDGKSFSIMHTSGRRMTAQSLEIDDCLVAIDIDSKGTSFAVGGGYIGFGEVVHGPSAKRPVNHTIPRNSLCQCESGRKYKHCCGAY